MPEDGRSSRASSRGDEKSVVKSEEEMRGEQRRREEEEKEEAWRRKMELDDGVVWDEERQLWFDVRCGHTLTRPVPNNADMGPEEMRRPACLFCDAERQVPADLASNARFVADIRAEAARVQDYYEELLRLGARVMRFGQDRRDYLEWLEKEIMRTTVKQWEYNDEQMELPESERKEPRDFMKEEEKAREGEAPLPKNYGQGYRLAKKTGFNILHDQAIPLGPDFIEENKDRDVDDKTGVTTESDKFLDAKLLPRDEKHEQLVRQWQKCFPKGSQPRKRHFGRCALRSAEWKRFVPSGFERLHNWSHEEERAQLNAGIAADRLREQVSRQIREEGRADWEKFEEKRQLHHPNVQFVDHAEIVRQAQGGIEVPEEEAEESGEESEQEVDAQDEEEAEDAGASARAAYTVSVARIREQRKLHEEQAAAADEADEWDWSESGEESAFGEEGGENDEEYETSEGGVAEEDESAGLQTRLGELDLQSSSKRSD